MRLVPLLGALPLGVASLVGLLWARSRVISSCWSLRSSSAASGYGGSLWRHRRWRWCGDQFGFSGSLEKFYKPLRFLGTFSRGRVLLGGHPLWRSAPTGAGSAALGRHSLAHGVETVGGVMTKLTERNTTTFMASNPDVHDVR